MALAREYAVAIEIGRNDFVRTNPRQLPNRLDNFGRAFGTATQLPPEQRDAGPLESTPDASGPKDHGSAGRAPVEQAGTGAVAGAGGNGTQPAHAGTGGSPAAGSGGTGGSVPSVSYVELVAELTLIASSQLDKPSDLAFNPYVQDELWVELHEQRVYVSDNETGIIYRFGLDGTPLGTLTIPGVAARGLAGLAFGPDGKLYFVDMGGSRVLCSETKF